MAVAADNSDKNNRVWKSLLGLVNVSIFFTLLTLFRMKCQAVGASTVRYGDVTQAAMIVQVRGLRGGVTQAVTGGWCWVCPAIYKVCGVSLNPHYLIHYYLSLVLQMFGTSKIKRRLSGKGTRMPYVDF